MQRLVVWCVWALLLVPALTWGQTTECLPNELGVNRVNSGTALTVGSTAIKVADKELKRCQLTLINRSGGSLSCLPSWQGLPTTTKGLIILGGEQLVQETSGRGEWSCIAVTTDVTLVVLEEMPNVP